MRKTKHFTLTPVQQQTVRQHMPFADAIASTFANRPVDMDDLKQEAFISLCYAITTYKGINNATFETFLSKYITGNLKHFIQHYSRTQILSIDDDDVQTEHAPSLTITSLSKYDEDEGNLSFEETLPDPDSMKSEKQVEYKILAERLLSILTDRERRMVKCAFYIDRQSQIRMRIWQRFNLNKSRFYDIVDNAITKMAKYAHDNHIESPF